MFPMKAQGSKVMHTTIPFEANARGAMRYNNIERDAMYSKDFNELHYPTQAGNNPGCQPKPERPHFKTLGIQQNSNSGQNHVWTRGRGGSIASFCDRYSNCRFFSFHQHAIIIILLFPWPACYRCSYNVHRGEACWG